MEQTAPTQEKRLIINRYTVFTIPNILVFIRILCVPVYMTLLILGSRANETNSYEHWWIYVALGVLVFAAITDILDGKIARKYKAGTKIGKYTVKHDQGTYVGQCIDPVGDKAMHIGALLALCIATSSVDGGPYLHWAFLLLLVMRELCMVVVGSFIVNDVNIKANMLGKVASCIISCGAILCFFHPHMQSLVPNDGWTTYTIDWIIVTIGLVLNWAAAVNYAIVNFTILAQVKKERKAAELVAQNGEVAATEDTQAEVVENSEENKD